ncbi:hypothetical protein ABIA39_000992 [Nocardia sp. GAS34]|uniref:hypothetical protein n=1 Tax=unclassified Nocardia TaxID=2637762 RepID=UPI003D20CF25
MAVVHRPSRVARTVDIAGTRWPVYKLEALGLGLLTCVLLVLIVGSPQVAVLAAAAVGALRWSVALLVSRIRPVL